METVVAIDGPAASGKSTVARRVAAEMGLLYVDSGAVYRGLTWKALAEGLAMEDRAGIAAMAERVRAAPFVAEGSVRVRLDGVDPSPFIRTRDVTENVSFVAAVPEVRTRVVAWLRGMTRFGGLVMEGRDIGTVVFPDTPFKFYLEATADERARRRHAERTDGASAASVGQVQQALTRRDAIDSGRQTAPLRPAADARIIDTTSLSIHAVVQTVVAGARGAGGRSAE